LPKTDSHSSFPLPPELFSYLSTRLGYTTPHWLTLVNFGHIYDPLALNERAFQSLNIPLVDYMQSDSPFTYTKCQFPNCFTSQIQAFNSQKHLDSFKFFNLDTLYRYSSSYNPNFPNNTIHYFSRAIAPINFEAYHQFFSNFPKPENYLHNQTEPLNANT
jgi:hypothetical protein